MLSNKLRDEFENSNDLNELKKEQASLFDLLVKNGFIIDKKSNESQIAEYNRLKLKLDKNLYHLVINPTMDCNLDCWYCYEKKVKDSEMSPDVVKLVINNIIAKFETDRYKVLKLSFFGGEPLLKFNPASEIINAAREFCEKNSIFLRLDFTTNATLLSKKIIRVIGKDFAEFQITLDGNREKHNLTRINKKTGANSYDTIISNIKKIILHVPNSYVWIRINFDKDTLENIDDIIYDLKDINRSRCSIIFRKIWQVNISTISKDRILYAITQFINNKFKVDYFALPRINPCFAERESQALINYDGKIFKCSTLDDFCDKHAIGVINENGLIKFDEGKIANKIIPHVQNICRECKIYPACYGPCSQNVQTDPNNEFCILSMLGLIIEELIIYNFKLRHLYL